MVCYQILFATAAIFPILLVAPSSRAEVQAPTQTSANPQPVLPQLNTATTVKVLSEITHVSTSAKDLLPERQDVAQASSTSDPATSDPATEPKQPTTQSGKGAGFVTGTEGGRLDIQLTGGADKPFTFGFGSRVPDVSALNGVTRKRTVLRGANQSSVIYITNYFKYRLGETQNLLLETAIDPRLFSFDLSYRSTPTKPDRGFSVNLFNQRSWLPVFIEGDREVNLPNGDTPWVHRLGVGAEVFQPLAPKLDAALGLNYQLVSVRDGAFASELFPFDELGDRLTVSSDGQDILFTLNFVAHYNDVDNLSDPTRGIKARVGIDQSFPVGNASILFTRFAGNVTQFIPLNLFGFGPGPRTLVLNVQAGTMIGDVPPYEAFSLGGISSVRGFGKGNIGSGRSFIQTTVEYRFPLFSFTVLKFKWDVRGVLFLDYATDLGTADSVIGRPAEVREKPGSGLGYGFGVAIRIPIGLIRLEMGFTDRGDSQFQFDVGDRF